MSDEDASTKSKAAPRKSKNTTAKTPNKGAVRTKAKTAPREKKSDSVPVLDKVSFHALTEDELNKVILHCLAALRTKKEDTASRSFATRSSQGACYTKSGSSSEVVIWDGPFPRQGTMSQAEAEANGILPCGG